MLRALALAPLALLCACTEQELPQTAEATIEYTLTRLRDKKDPGVLWDVLPASYQSDIHSWCHKLGAKLPGKAYDKLFILLRKIGIAIKTKGEFLLAYGPAQYMMRTTGVTDEDEVLTLLAAIGNVPILIGDSEISTTKKLQSADIGKFLHNTGTKVWAQGARAYLAVGPAVSAMTEMAGGGTPMPSVVKGMNSGLDGLTFKTLKSEADRAQIELTLNGRTELMAFTKVEERWVPTDVVDQWAKMKPSIESFLDSLESPETHKLMDDMEKILDQMIADLDKLEAIQSRGKFFTALEKMGKKYVDQFKDVVTQPR